MSRDEISRNFAETAAKFLIVKFCIHSVTVSAVFFFFFFLLTLLSKMSHGRGGGEELYTF
jgi:hypothetical protein